MNAWWLRISAYGVPYWRRIVVVTLAILAGAIFNALLPWPLKLIVDHVLVHTPLPRNLAWLSAIPGAGRNDLLLLYLACASVALFVASQAATLLRMYTQAGLGARMIYAVGAALFERYQAASLLFHGRRSSGDLVRRATVDASCIQDLVLGVYFSIGAAAANLVVMFAIMWAIDIRLTLIAVCVALPLALLIRLYSGPLTRRSYEQQEAEGELMTVAERTLTALPMVQSMGAESFESARFQASAERVYRTQMRATSTQVWFGFLSAMPAAAGTALLIFGGGIFALRGEISLGDLLVFLSYLASLYAPLEALAYASTGFAAAGARARRVLEVLDEDRSLPESRNPRQLDAARGGRTLKLDAVVFGYEPDRPVLEGLSLQALPGESVALVGPTGAGKSTLISLLPRFYDVWRGAVTCDGIDVRDLRVTELRRQFAIVPQDPLLLPVSILENIAYGRPDAPFDEILEAARMAHCHSFVERLPNGYETVLAERGSSISGGEKQRLAIARALLRDAPVLILDEPTAALDAETEALVVDALRTLMKGRTAFIVAHRLSTIKHATRIAFIEDGRIVEEGPYDNLIAARGRFWQFQQLHRGAGDPH